MKEKTSPLNIRGVTTKTKRRLASMAKIRGITQGEMLGILVE